MAGNMRMGLLGILTFSTKPWKNRLVAVTYYMTNCLREYRSTPLAGGGGCCMKFSINLPLEESPDCVTLWVSQALSWVLPDPSAPTSNYITRPVTRVFLPTTISISIPAHWIISDRSGSIGDESFPKGGPSDIVLPGHTHPPRAQCQKVPRSRFPYLVLIAPCNSSNLNAFAHLVCVCIGKLADNSDWRSDELWWKTNYCISLYALNNFKKHLKGSSKNATMFSGISQKDLVTPYIPLKIKMLTI